MKRFYILRLITGLFMFLASSQAMAQCGTCSPNEALLTPATNYPEGALAPDPAPAMTQGIPYDEVITYVMPATYDAGPPVGVVNVDQVIVSTISGLPSGVLWNCGVPDCTYFPQTYQYGCIRFCGTTFVAPGIYPVEVTVLGTALGVTQPSTFLTQIEVLPATGGNTGFSFSPISGCDEVTSTFEGLIDGTPNPTTYDWTFANGNTSVDQMPEDQTFSTSGNNEITLVTTIWDYVLESVTATAVSNEWCGDIEEANLFGQCQGDPDMVFDLTNGAGAIVVSGAEVSNQITATWTGIDMILDPTNGPFSFQFQDVDAVSQWDDLGGPSFNITAPGTFSSTGTHVSVSYTIGLVAQSVITNVDTVVVNVSPDDAVISNNGADAFCVGDSAQLMASASANVTFQWYSTGVEIIDATTNTLWVDTAGVYTVSIIDTLTACVAASNSYTIAVEEFPPIPVISYNSGGGYLEVPNAGSFNVQWFLDGIAIPNATSPTFAGVTTSGPYTVELSSNVGCSEMSFPYTLCLPGSVQPLANDTVCCGDQLTLVAEGFTVNSSSAVIWAMTSEADGPITSQADADAAQALNQVFPGSNDSLIWNRTCTNLDDSLATGSYYFTPFTAQDPNVEPLVWDTLNADCRPNGIMCPTLVGEDSTWQIFPMIFTFPDGSILNVNDALAFGLPLSQPLLDLGGGLPCLGLTDLYAGDPNGLWTISITNTGPVSIDLGVPDFVVVNYADSCSLITEDQVYTIPGLSVTAGVGETVEAQFWIPPLPGGFPTVDENCAAFGTPQLVHFADCFPGFTNTLSLICNAEMSTLVTGSGFIDVTVSGGVAPYSYVWSDGPTTEDRFNLMNGTYVLVVTDANGFSQTCSSTITGPSLGVGELEAFGFSLEQNIPNPAGNSTVIPFISASSEVFEFTIVSVDGRTIVTQDVKASIGNNRIEVDVNSVAAGMYYYSISNGINKLTKRMMISKD